MTTKEATYRANRKKRETTETREMRKTRDTRGTRERHERDDKETRETGETRERRGVTTDRRRDQRLAETDNNSPNPSARALSCAAMAAFVALSTVLNLSV